MRPTVPALLLMLSACAPQDVEVSSGKPHFAAFPDRLFDAVEAACTDPSETFVRLGRDSVQCRILLPPEPTASLILQYDGTPGDLPHLVIQFSAVVDAPGYIVANETYVLVPQKTGAPLRLKRADSELDRMIDALYEKAGGTPV